MPFAPMTTTQQFTVSINPTDRKGKPAPIDGDATWATSNDAVATVTSTGPNAALVVAQGVGDYVISASADADLGEGVVTITGQDSGSVSQGTATNIGLVAGPVTEQP